MFLYCSPEIPSAQTVVRKAYRELCLSMTFYLHVIQQIDSFMQLWRLKVNKSRSSFENLMFSKLSVDLTAQSSTKFQLIWKLKLQQTFSRLDSSKFSKLSVDFTAQSSRKFQLIWKFKVQQNFSRFKNSKYKSLRTFSFLKKKPLSCRSLATNENKIYLFHISSSTKLNSFITSFTIHDFALGFRA